MNRATKPLFFQTQACASMLEQFLKKKSQIGIQHRANYILQESSTGIFQLEVRAMAPSQQRLRVCETCGAQLNILDHESRLADHYGGKMHLGMVDIREKYEALKVGLKFYV